MKTTPHAVTSILVVLVSVTTLTDVRARCPARCFCQHSSRTVYCSRRGLDAIPDSVPPATRQLHLNGNHFLSTVIRRANFSRFPDVIQMKLWPAASFKRISGLGHLYMSDCAISEIEAEAFGDLLHLRWLDLSDNQLTTLSDATFAGSRLHQLFLNGNRLLVLDRGQPFLNATVSGLYLHDCRLTRLNATVLAPLVGSIRVLWLSENRFSTLDVALSRLFASLDHFRLAGNQMHCNCELSWLLRIYKDRARLSNARLSAQVFDCSSPPSLQGRKFTELSNDEMSCRAPSLADVEVTLLDTDDGDRSSRRRLVLRCTATGDPSPTVYWVGSLAAGRGAPSPSTDSEKESTDNVGEALLVVDDSDVLSTSSEHSAFTCVARNVIGRVTLTVRRAAGTWEVASDNYNAETRPKYTYSYGTAANASNADEHQRFTVRNTSASRWPTKSENDSSGAACNAASSESGPSRVCRGRDRQLRASVRQDTGDVRRSSRLRDRQYAVADLLGVVVTTVLLTAVIVVASAIACLRHRDRTDIVTSTPAQFCTVAHDAPRQTVSATTCIDDAALQHVPTKSLQSKPVNSVQCM